MSSPSAAKNLAAMIVQAVEEIESDTANQIPGGVTSDVNQPIVAPEDALELNPRRRAALRTLEAATHQLIATLMPIGWRLINLHAGYFQTVAINVAVRGGIADLIHSIDPDSSKGGVHVQLLAQKAGMDPRKLKHFLRFLALHNVFCEMSPDHWANNRGSVPLRTDSSNTVCNSLAFAAEEIALPVFLELPNVLFDKEDGSAFSYDPRLSAFNRYFKPDGDFFDFLSKSEGGWRARRFGNTMFELANMDPLPYKAFDWKKELGPTGTLIDIGGGIGAAAYAISGYLPEWNIVVQDRPEVVKHGKENYEKIKSTARVKFEEADFFKEQPSHRIGGADVYFLRHILHDWPFNPCVEILTHLRKAAKPTTRLLAYEINLEPPLLDSKSPILSNGGMASFRAHGQNLGMISTFNAEERNKEEYADLFKASGWILQDTTPMTAGDEFIFQGTPDLAWRKDFR